MPAHVTEDARTIARRFGQSRLLQSVEKTIALGPTKKALERVQKIEDAWSAIESENARRVPCPHCELAILPEGMARHIAIVHDDD